ncbi:MAG: type II toxin-antitoxin system RelE/ParE family toxin [Fibromonadales bacterium]|nr:type II toxin-antitoxin system RelE/ParE family toxin [Fibromonadales bacterium]
MAKGIVFFDELKTPPLENDVRMEMGKILREFQNGETPGAPLVKPVTQQIGKNCHEIRYPTAQHNWRVYLAVRDIIVVLLLEDKKSKAIPQTTVETCKSRLRFYEQKQSERNKN